MKSQLASPITHAEPVAAWMAEPSVEALPQTRHERIAALAYRLAEERGFAPGAELDDWLQAEREIDAEDACED